MSWVQAETSEERFLKRTVRWVEHASSRGLQIQLRVNRLFQMCDLGRARTKGATSPDVKDSRQRDGDETVNDVQTSWLRSLVGVLGYLATDRPDLQYLVENLTRNITHGTCGTLDRARRAVRYLVHKPHSRNVIPTGNPAGVSPRLP